MRSPELARMTTRYVNETGERQYPCSARELKLPENWELHHRRRRVTISLPYMPGSSALLAPQRRRQSLLLRLDADAPILGDLNAFLQCQADTLGHNSLDSWLQ